MRVFFFILVFVLGASLASAQTPQPPIEAYGNLPQVSSFAISPTGTHLAFISRRDGANALVVNDLSTNESWGVGIADLKITDVRWAGPEHVVMSGFEVTRFQRSTSKSNYTGAFSVNINEREVVQLMTRTADLYTNQTGIGRIVGLSTEYDGSVMMPAYSRSSGRGPNYSLFRVNLDTGKGRISVKGMPDVTDYIIGRDGTLLAQERYSNRTNNYSIYSRQSGKLVEIYSADSPEGPKGLVGIMPDASALVFFSRAENGFNALYKMDFEGNITNAVMARDGVEIAQVLLGQNRTVVGVEYGGLEPSYEFFDATITAAINKVQEQVGTATVRLDSWTDDWAKLILYIEGTNYSGNFIMLDRTTGSMTGIGNARPDIPSDAIGEVLTIEYNARDGLKIPALLTIPRGAEISNLPLIVMPHGGPETHDQVGFDYMAQYFANRGYLVFQPNFRGSDGFGTEFTEAGYGGWGSSMQHDITDGVKSLIAGGQVDAERVCIVGWSYGGYAALAGGAFTPDLYQCVASIAGVSDLPRILVDERRDHGRDHWVVEYWEAAMANNDASREVLRQKSPSMFADNFQAPVLLLHGRDDLTVKINQSRIMRRALERADRPVELIEYRGGDHSLLSPGDRLKALQELDRFITTHIGPN